MDVKGKRSSLHNSSDQHQGTLESRAQTLREQVTNFSNASLPHAPSTTNEQHDLRIILEHIDYGVMFMDKDLNARSINSAFQKMWGVGKDFVDSNPNFFEMIQYLRDKGSYDVSDDQWIDYVKGRYEAVLAADGVGRSSQRSDGKHLFYKCIALADGGRILTYFDMTEQKRHEEVLRESEQRFRDFAEIASDWFWETDAEHRFIWFSIKSPTFDGMLGKTRWEVGDADDDLTDWGDLKTALNTHSDFSNIEFCVRKPNNSKLWISANGQPLINANGQFIGFRGTARDITGEIESSNEVMRAEKHLYNAIEAMEDGFVLFDAEDQLVICNQNYKDVYKEIADVLKPGVTFSTIAQAAMECDQIENRLKDKEAWLKNRVKQHLNPSGPFDQKLARGNWLRIIERKTADGGIIGLRIDITKEKQEEEKLRKLSLAVEQSPSMVFITDIEGRIEYINPVFTTMCGYTFDEVIGKNPRILKSDETPKDTYDFLWQSIKSGHEWRGELKDRRKDGSTFWAYVSISPVKNEYDQITHFVAMHEDITQRKEIAIREHQARKAAETANRAKSELMANMSHELRTPLNAIIGFSETMKEETFGPVGSDKNREYLNDIHHSGQHLLELINDILDVSAIEADALELYEENVSLVNVVEISVRLINPRASAGQVNVTSTLDPEIPLIFADERRVKQVFLNLLSNAVKFSPEGGEVTVRAQLNDDGSLAVAVADNGIGMDEEEVTMALSAFGQVDSGLDRKHEGTGLGLPLTKGLMDLHGGTMEIESVKDHGSLITVTFPKERVI